MGNVTAGSSSLNSLYSQIQSWTSDLPASAPQALWKQVWTYARPRSAKDQVQDCIMLGEHSTNGVMFQLLRGCSWGMVSVGEPSPIWMVLSGNGSQCFSNASVNKCLKIPDTYVGKEDGGSCGGCRYRYTTVPTLQKGIAVMHWADAVLF